MDDDGNKQIEMPEWRKALAEHRLEGTLSEQQVNVCSAHCFAARPALKASFSQGLFDYFDSDDSGSISYDEFLVGVRGEMNAGRARLVSA